MWKPYHKPSIGEKYSYEYENYYVTLMHPISIETKTTKWCVIDHNYALHVVDMPNKIWHGIFRLFNFTFWFLIEENVIQSSHADQD